MVDYYIPHTVFILFLYIAIKSTHTFTTEMLQKFSVREWASSLQRQALETVNLRAAKPANHEFATRVKHIILTLYSRNWNM